MIHYTCPQCGEELESPDCLVGEMETCPACQAAVQVPASQTEPEPPQPAATQPPPPAPFEPEDSAADLASTEAPEPTEDVTEEIPATEQTPSPPAPFQPETQPQDSPPAPFEPQGEIAPAAAAPFEPAADASDAPANDFAIENADTTTRGVPGEETQPDEQPQPAADDDEDISLGIFDDAPSAEQEIEQEEQAQQAAPADQGPPTDKLPTARTDAPRKRDSSSMPPPSPPQTDPNWGILEHAQAAQQEVSEEDYADVAAYATGQQEPQSPAGDDVSEEDVVTQIDIGALAAKAGHQPPPSADDSNAGVFIPGMLAHEDVTDTPPAAAPQQPQTPTAPPKPGVASVKPHPPLPLTLLGGLKVLLAVLLAAVVVIIGLVQAGTLSAENYAFLDGLLAWRPMTLLAVNAVILLLAGTGYMMLKPFGKFMGWFWVFQIFVVLGAEVFLRLRNGTTVGEILQPGPLGLIAGSIFLAILSAAILFAYSRRFKQPGTVEVLPDATADNQPPTSPPPPIA